MNIWQPQWTDDKTIEFSPNDVKYTRMKYFVLDLGRVHRQFRTTDRTTWITSRSNLVFQDLELKFRFTFNRGILNKYFPKGIKVPYATALRQRDLTRTVLNFYQTLDKKVGGDSVEETETFDDYDSSTIVTVTSSASELCVTVKPKYFIWQADENVKLYPVGMQLMSYDVTLPSIMLWLPDLPEYKTINDVFTKKVDESIITFQVWSTNGTYYANQKGIIRLPVYSLASAATAWNDLYIQITGDSFNPKLFINEQQPNDWTQFTWRLIEDPRTWLEKIENLPVPLPVNSRSHRNYSWSENGIKYISTGPSSGVLEETFNKKSHWIVALFNKLTKRRSNEKQ